MLQNSSFSMYARGRGRGRIEPAAASFSLATPADFQIGSARISSSEKMSRTPWGSRGEKNYGTQPGASAESQTQKRIFDENNISFCSQGSGESPRHSLPQQISQHGYAARDTATTSAQPFQFQNKTLDVKLPNFWETDVSLWFLTVENLFRQKGIFDENKMYEFLLVALDLRHLQRVKHVLVNLSPTRPFSQLRNALFEAYEPSIDSKLDGLLDASELGDRRPTELLSRMRHLMGTEQSPTLLKKLFLSKLPVDVKRVVVASGTDSIDELAERADRVLAADSAIDTTSRRHENQKLTQCDQSLKERVNDLIDSVNELVNCSQNPGYQPQPFSHFRSPGDKRSNGWKNSWSKSDFSTPQKTNPKQPRFQNRSPRAWSEPRPRFAGAQSFPDRPRQSFSRPPTPFRPRNETPQFGFMGSLYTHKNDGNGLESSDQGLFFVKDPETHLKFLIDTGSKRSVLPCWRPDGHPTTTGYLRAANGSNVPVYECVDLELPLNMNRIFAWKFCKARVQFPI